MIPNDSWRAVVVPEAVLFVGTVGKKGTTYRPIFFTHDFVSTIQVLVIVNDMHPKIFFVLLYIHAAPHRERRQRVLSAARTWMVHKSARRREADR